jgi:hypothetical protein
MTAPYFLPLTTPDDLTSAARAASDARLAEHTGPITPLEATLLGHLPSFAAYQSLYTLTDELVPYIGERAVTLFSYAISDATDALVASVSLRKTLIDSGENVDNPQVTETEQLLMDWGRLIARDPNGIPDDMVARLTRAFNPKLRIMLVAFAGQLVATNLVTTLARIPLDDALFEYRKSGDERVV